MTETATVDLKDPLNVLLQRAVTRARACRGRCRTPAPRRCRPCRTSAPARCRTLFEDGCSSFSRRCSRSVLVCTTWKYRLQVIGVQRGDGQAPLLAPFIPLGQEDTREADALLQLAPAPVTSRAVPQNRVDRLEIPDAHEAPRSKVEAKDRTVVPAPALRHGMQRARAHLVRVAQERQPRGPGRSAIERVCSIASRARS